MQIIKSWLQRATLNFAFFAALIGHAQAGSINCDVFTEPVLTPGANSDIAKLEMSNADMLAFVTDLKAMGEGQSEYDFGVGDVKFLGQFWSSVTFSIEKNAWNVRKSEINVPLTETKGVKIIEKLLEEYIKETLGISAVKSETGQAAIDVGRACSGSGNEKCVLVYSSGGRALQFLKYIKSFIDLPPDESVMANQMVDTNWENEQFRENIESLLSNAYAKRLDFDFGLRVLSVLMKSRHLLQDSALAPYIGEGLGNSFGAACRAIRSAEERAQSYGKSLLPAETESREISRTNSVPHPIEAYSDSDWIELRNASTAAREFYRKISKDGMLEDIARRAEEALKASLPPIPAPPALFGEKPDDERGSLGVPGEIGSSQTPTPAGATLVYYVRAEDADVPFVAAIGSAALGAPRGDAEQTREVAVDLLLRLSEAGGEQVDYPLGVRLLRMVEVLSPSGQRSLRRGPDGGEYAVDRTGAGALALAFGVPRVLSAWAGSGIEVSWSDGNALPSAIYRLSGPSWMGCPEQAVPLFGGAAAAAQSLRSLQAKISMWLTECRSHARTAIEGKIGGLFLARSGIEITDLSPFDDPVRVTFGVSFEQYPALKLRLAGEWSLGAGSAGRFHLLNQREVEQTVANLTRESLAKLSIIKDLPATGRLSIGESIAVAFKLTPPSEGRLGLTATISVQGQQQPFEWSVGEDQARIAAGLEKWATERANAFLADQASRATAGLATKFADAIRGQRLFGFVVAKAEVGTDDEVDLCLASGSEDSADRVFLSGVKVLPPTAVPGIEGDWNATNFRLLGSGEHKLLRGSCEGQAITEAIALSSLFPELDILIALKSLPVPPQGIRFQDNVLEVVPLVVLEGLGTIDLNGDANDVAGALRIRIDSRGVLSASSENLQAVFLESLNRRLDRLGVIRLPGIGELERPKAIAIAEDQLKLAGNLRLDKDFSIEIELMADLGSGTLHLETNEDTIKKAVKNRLFGELINKLNEVFRSSADDDALKVEIERPDGGALAIAISGNIPLGACSLNVSNMRFVPGQGRAGSPILTGSCAGANAFIPLGSGLGLVTPSLRLDLDRPDIIGIGADIAAGADAQSATAAANAIKIRSALTVHLTGQSAKLSGTLILGNTLALAQADGSIDLKNGEARFDVSTTGNVSQILELKGEGRLGQLTGGLYVKTLFKALGLTLNDTEFWALVSEPRQPGAMVCGTAVGPHHQTPCVRLRSGIDLGFLKGDVDISGNSRLSDLTAAARLTIKVGAFDIADARASIARDIVSLKFKILNTIGVSMREETLYLITRERVAARIAEVLQSMTNLNEQSIRAFFQDPTIRFAPIARNPGQSLDEVSMDTTSGGDSDGRGGAGGSNSGHNRPPPGYVPGQENGGPTPASGPHQPSVTDGTPGQTADQPPPQGMVDVGIGAAGERSYAALAPAIPPANLSEWFLHLDTVRLSPSPSTGNGCPSANTDAATGRYMLGVIQGAVAEFSPELAKNLVVGRLVLVRLFDSSSDAAQNTVAPALFVLPYLLSDLSEFGDAALGRLQALKPSYPVDRLRALSPVSVRLIGEAAQWAIDRNKCGGKWDFGSTAMPRDNISDQSERPFTLQFEKGTGVTPRLLIFRPGRGGLSRVFLYSSTDDYPNATMSNIKTGDPQGQVELFDDTILDALDQYFNGISDFERGVSLEFGERGLDSLQVTFSLYKYIGDAVNQFAIFGYTAKIKYTNTDPIIQGTPVITGLGTFGEQFKATETALKDICKAFDSSGGCTLYAEQKEGSYFYFSIYAILRNTRVLDKNKGNKTYDLCVSRLRSIIHTGSMIADQPQSIAGCEIFIGESGAAKSETRPSVPMTLSTFSEFLALSKSTLNNIQNSIIVFPLVRNINSASFVVRKNGELRLIPLFGEKRASVVIDILPSAGVPNLDRDFFDNYDLSKAVAMEVGGGAGATTSLGCPIDKLTIGLSYKTQTGVVLCPKQGGKVRQLVVGVAKDAPGQNPKVIRLEADYANLNLALRDEIDAGCPSALQSVDASDSTALNAKDVVRWVMGGKPSGPGCADPAGFFEVVGP